MSYVRCFIVSFIALLALSVTAQSQESGVLDSAYATAQRAVLKQYPTALFPIPRYEEYDIASESQDDGTIDAIVGPSGDYAECKYIFPSFRTWDILSEETRKDPTKQIYVVLTFYFQDSVGSLQEGRSSSVVVRIKSKRKSAPARYELSDPNDSTSVFQRPDSVQTYSCKRLLSCLVSDDPIRTLVVAMCK